MNVVRTNTTTNVTTTNTASTWNLHLASGGCTLNATTGSYSCTNSNRIAVKLANFNASNQKIALDLNALLKGTDLTTDTSGATGCMSSSTDTDCLPIFNALNINLASGSALIGSAQTAFIAQNK